MGRGRVSSNHGHGKGTKPVWPEYWKLEELEKVKATLPVG